MPQQVMVKKRDDIAHSSLNIAIDNMGVKVALRLNGEGFKDQEVQSIQNSGASTNKIAEKPRRSKGMEKSVLDDIMGDPDDFGDLGDLDAGSESDGGRWEDTLKTEMEEEADALGVALPAVNMDTKGREKASPDGTPKENASMVDSSLTDCKQEPDAFEEQEALEEPGSASHRKCGKHPQRINQWRVKHLSNNIMINGASSEEGRLHSTRYFIIKSLNHRNIQMSIEKGIWATQVMNEPILEEAFHNSERVVLIFSVNMSGYFQGCAQMMSPVGWKRENVWNESNNGTNPWGRTFKVRWLRLYNLPFQKTVHLKNPLNEYKPVKISRDCQELTQEIGEALCGLIDEGAEFEGKHKRKMAVRDSTLTKRLHRDYGSATVDGNSMGGYSTSQGNWPIIPMLYPSAQHLPVNPLERYNPSGGLVSNMTSGHLEEPKASTSRSPFAMERINDRHRERERPSGTDVNKERSRAGGNSRHGVDYLPEEDLLHMTYEEYLQKTCGNMSEYSGCPPTPGVWMGNGVDLTFPDDQYANYLANWYQNQNPMTAGNIYYGAPQIINTYPAIHHP